MTKVSRMKNNYRETENRKKKVLCCHERKEKKKRKKGILHINRKYKSLLCLYMCFLKKKYNVILICFM